MRILIVTSNRLTGLGLKTLIGEAFSQEDITVAADSEADPGTADCIFLNSDIYVLHEERFRPFRNRLVILTAGTGDAGGHSGLRSLDTSGSEADIIDRLRSILPQPKRPARPDQDTLTDRELDVLRLVATGHLNKEIADSLSISQHTVISHRKNITRKLGIKTVSGLTMYALLNDLIPPTPIQ